MYLKQKFSGTQSKDIFEGFATSRQIRAENLRMFAAGLGYSTSDFSANVWFQSADPTSLFENFLSILNVHVK